MGRARKASAPQVRFNRYDFSREVVIRGAAKHLPVGVLVEGAPKDVYRVEVRDVRDLPIGALYAAYLLTENMAKGPDAAEVAVAESDRPPVRLTAAAINDVNPEALRSEDVRDLCERLGINEFSDIMVSETETRLTSTLHVLGMGEAAVEACNVRPRFVA